MADEKQAEEKPKPKAKRNRRFAKEVLSEDTKQVTMKVKHVAHKGEKISDTVRKDRKFDPRQRMTDLNGRFL